MDAITDTMLEAHLRFASDWAAERTNYPREMAEIALAHNVGSDVERAYRRGDMVEKRREMMEYWARFIFGVNGER